MNGPEPKFWPRGFVVTTVIVLLILLYVFFFMAPEDHPPGYQPYGGQGG